MLKKLFSHRDKPVKKVLVLQKISHAFKNTFADNAIKWQWDSRFNSVLAEFDASQQEKVLAILSVHFTDYWDSHCIDDAPKSVQSVNHRLGGLKPGQLFFSTDVTKPSFLYCAWWPWDMGKTISIRISLEQPLDADEDAYPLQERCQHWFNITPSAQWDKFSSSE